MNEKYGSLTGLIVDDSEYMQHLLKMMLRAFGIGAVEAVSSVRDGLRYLRAEMPDFVIVDWMMADVSGIELVRQIRSAEKSLNPYLPIIMVTGHASKTKIAQARDAGVNEFLAKPLSPLSLASRLTEIIERPRPFVRSANYFGPDRRRQAVKISRPDRRKDECHWYTTPEQIRAFVEELRGRMAEGPVTRVATETEGEAETATLGIATGKGEG